MEIRQWRQIEWAGVEQNRSIEFQCLSETVTIDDRSLTVLLDVAIDLFLRLLAWEA